MFRGLAALNLDSKGRMAIPTRYRETLLRTCQGQMVITVDRDHCLLLYTLPDWEEIERKLVRLPSFNKQARRLQRLLIGHATECELDGNGRILLPPALREFAGLNKTVVLIGQGNKFEVWAEEAWNTRRADWLGEAGDEDGELPDELGSLSL
ncbi:MAG: division/cell wall cluster transcriptional repressor MraZ [Acidiferrobacterales bacterium]